MTWASIRLKHAVKNVLDAPDRPLPLVALEHIAPRAGTLVAGYEPMVVDRGDYVRFQPGDVLFGKLRPYLRKTWLATFSGCCPKELLVLRAAEGKVDARYLAYLTQSDLFADLAAISSDGVKMPRTSWEALAGFGMSLPPLVEQMQLVTYLNRETAEIGAVLARKDRLTRLLQQRLISGTRQVVLAGFGSPQVDTGLPWQPSVPDSWRPTKLPYLADFAGGSTPERGNEAYWNGSIPWVTAKDMKDPWIRSSKDMVTAEALESTGLHLHEAPVVLMVVRGMILAHTLPVAVTRAPVTINQDLKALRPRRSCDAEYLRNLLSAVAPAILAVLIEEAAHGTKALRTDRLKGFELFIPPVAEQQRINKYVQEASERIKRLTDSLNLQTRLLRQRRAVVITAAVTGQIEVPATTYGVANTVTSRLWEC